MISDVQWRDPDADRKLCEQLGVVGIERAICDGQRGYAVTTAHGVKIFYFRLGDALRFVLLSLGHSNDRDLFILGEPDTGNCW